MTFTLEEKRTALQRVSLFDDLTPTVLDELLSQSTEKPVKAGQVVGREGELNDSVFIVLQGSVRIDHKRRTVRLMKPYDLYGEWTLLQAKPQTTSVVVVQDGVLLWIDGQSFLASLRDNPDLMMRLLTECNARLWDSMEDLSVLRDQLEEVILPLGVSLAQETTREGLADRVVEESMRLCEADAGVLLLAADGSDTLAYSVLCIDSLGLHLGGVSGNEMPFAPVNLNEIEESSDDTVSLLREVVTEGRTANVADIADQVNYSFAETKARDTALDYASHSCLTAALRDQSGTVVGVLQLFNAKNTDDESIVPFSPTQQLMVESLTAQAAVAYNTQLMLHREQEYVKLEQDVQVARRIQAGFLPSELPQIEGYEIAARFQPAREVAGDWYDAFMMTQNRRLGFVIADVVDKGVPAALFMALVRSLTRAFAQQNYSVDWTSLLGDSGIGNAGQNRMRAMPSAGTMSLFNAVSLANNYILENHAEDNMFATLFFGMLNPDTGQLMYINAGHNPPHIISADGVVKASLTNTGAAVGMFPNIEYKIEEATLEPGDTVYTYTDGVTEARNAAGDFVTDDGLLRLLSAPMPSATALVEKVHTYLEGFMVGAAQADDITMLAIRRDA